MRWLWKFKKRLPHIFPKVRAVIKPPAAENVPLDDSCFDSIITFGSALCRTVDAEDGRDGETDSELG